MTTADSPHRGDGWAAAVRRRTGLGRLLPLGGPADGAWISERAAVAVLRDATSGPGAGPVLGRLRIRAAGPAPTPGPGPEPPPGALPPGPLRMEADMSAVPGRPLPAEAAALRSSLLAAADRNVGLVVSEVDVHVTELVETPPGPRAAAPVEVHPARPEGPRGAAAAEVPGVATLTRVLGGAVHAGPGHVRIELATEPGHRVLDVARAVRTAVVNASADRPSVVVLVTAVVGRDDVPQAPSGAFSR
ncbi:hypothetical protein [Streptomyces sp. NPDC014734]|uniref:hypothetical protein n=1 Tax=Streptomyces sp. NPDC014734 TaxID=3364886 RepID=UPI0036FCC4DC